HQVSAIVSDWQGEAIPGVVLKGVDVAGRSNHGRMKNFAQKVQGITQSEKYDCVIGFNRMPGLDVYFASDTCFREHVVNKSALVRLLPRYRAYLDIEKEVLGPEGPLILFLNEHQKRQYLAHYALPESRYRVLPPGIDRSRKRSKDYQVVRERMRDALGVGPGNTLILFLGSGFKVKG